jgi:hypothetical protein
VLQRDFVVLVAERIETRTVRDAPGARVPMVHCADPPAIVPREGTEASTMPAGMKSRMTTLYAVERPVLVTVIV